MRFFLRLFIALSACLTLLIPRVCSAQDNDVDPLKRVPKRVSASVVRITGVDMAEGNQPYTCTGFVVARHKVLTANHCVSALVRVDGRPTTTLGTAPSVDLALLSTDTNKPALRFAVTPPTPGTLVFGFGYGLGQYGQMITAHRVIVIAPVHPMPAGLILMGEMFGGMSGGPIVNEQGRVVGIVQRSNARLGTSFGATAATMLAFLQALK